MFGLFGVQVHPYNCASPQFQGRKNVGYHNYQDELTYSELKRHLNGITNTALTRCLRELEQDGIVIRNSTGFVPPSVTYELAATGKELIPALNGLYDWGDNHRNGNA